MRVRMVFMVLDVVWCEVPACKIPACGAGVRIPVCHGVAVKLAVRPDDRVVGLSGGAMGGRAETSHCPERLASRRLAQGFKSTWHNAVRRAAARAMAARGRDGEQRMQKLVEPDWLARGHPW